MKVETIRKKIKLVLEFESEEEWKEFKNFIHEFPHGTNYSDIINEMWEEIKHM